MFRSSRGKAVKAIVLSAVLGFAISLVLFLVLTLTLPLFGELLLGEPLLQGQDRIVLQGSMDFAVATIALVTFWWWTAVMIVAFFVSLYLLKLFRE